MSPEIIELKELAFTGADFTDCIRPAIGLPIGHAEANLLIAEEINKKLIEKLARHGTRLFRMNDGLWSTYGEGYATDTGIVVSVMEIKRLKKKKSEIQVTCFDDDPHVELKTNNDGDLVYETGGEK